MLIIHTVFYIVFFHIYTLEEKKNQQIDQHLFFKYLSKTHLRFANNNVEIRPSIYKLSLIIEDYFLIKMFLYQKLYLMNNKYGIALDINTKEKPDIMFVYTNWQLTI